MDTVRTVEIAIVLPAPRHQSQQLLVEDAVDQSVPVLKSPDNSFKLFALPGCATARDSSISVPYTIN
eukprot:COSAG02_NODE_6745_length_3386_cov_99.056528_1_plen_67_part_00